MENQLLLLIGAWGMRGQVEACGGGGVETPPPQMMPLPCCSQFL